MNRFQPFAVTVGSAPHVTMQAGVELAGRYWTTSSASAVKVRALEHRRHAAVLLDDGRDGWTLLAGEAAVLDIRRPFSAADDPVAGALVGPAVAKLALTYPDQVAGYVRDAGAVPRAWRPWSRVLIAVRADHRLRWVDGVVTEATGSFERAASTVLAASRRRRRRVSAQLLRTLAPDVAELVQRSGSCWLGVDSPIGPVVLPGWWDPDGATVEVDRLPLRRVGAVLPGQVCVTIDASDDPRPSRKAGVLARGAAGLLASSSGRATLAVHVERVSAWDGFAPAASSVPATDG